jgi:mycofactocin precursor
MHPVPDRPTKEADMTDPRNTAAETTATTELLAEDLIEEVSIDGMCGVY